MTDSNPSPRRIQRRRTKGWKMPEGAVYVGRPSRWGNPFMVTRNRGDWTVIDDNDVVYDDWPTEASARLHTVRLFAELSVEYGISFDVEAARTALAGHDLACWCPLDVPCHADVLLRVANGGDA
jgi:hypothetical protein